MKSTAGDSRPKHITSRKVPSTATTKTHRTITITHCSIKGKQGQNRETNKTVEQNTNPTATSSCSGGERSVKRAAQQTGDTTNPEIPLLTLTGRTRSTVVFLHKLSTDPVIALKRQTFTDWSVTPDTATLMMQPYTVSNERKWVKITFQDLRSMNN